MAKKYYAVRKGFKPGIYTTWEECKKNVDGFSGAEYKGFMTKEEAVLFCGDIAQGEKNNSSITTDNIEDSTSSEAVAYVDGSYNIATGEYSYGMVFYHNGEKLQMCEKFNDVEMKTMRNVAGEIEGSMHAMAYCIENGIKSIDIYYDYEGIEKWALGIWKTNKKGTINYKKYYDEVKDRLAVHFIKVKGHSGNVGNDEADMLAKKAVGVVK